MARFFYSDPVNTAIAVMSAFAVHAVGFTEGQALQVLLVLTVVAVIASFGWGFLADRWGPRRTLFAVLATWAVGLAILTLFLSTVPFLIAGALLGAGLGGVGVVDRLMLLRLAPPQRVGEMFGLYGLVGKFSAVVGPLVYGAIVAMLLDSLGRGAYQVAIASLFVLLLVGIAILRGVPEGEPESEVAAAERARAAGHGRVTIVVAHRGASAHAPENTMESFRLGVEAGADAIELDVHLTADGQLAVIHDETLDRTTDRTGARCRAHHGRDPRGRCGRGASHGPTTAGFPFAGQGLRVPTLAEVLEWLPDGIGLVIEIKARAAADAVVEAVLGHAARRGRSAGGDQLRRGGDRPRPRARSGDPDRVPARADAAGRAGARLGHRARPCRRPPWDGDLGLTPCRSWPRRTPSAARSAATSSTIPSACSTSPACGLWGFVTDVPDVAREALGPRGRRLDRGGLGQRHFAQRLARGAASSTASATRDARATDPGGDHGPIVHAARRRAGRGPAVPSIPG